MNIQFYLKERWLTFLFFLLISLFTYSVFKLDTGLTLTQSSETYILMGWLLFLFIFFLIDYAILTHRVKRIELFSQLQASNTDLDEFTYPLDVMLAKQIEHIVHELESYKREMDTRTAEELDFITKWLHDIKVPISAAKLIIESEEKSLRPNLYESLSRELFAIEESVQRVFYEIKSTRFHEDYKIAPASTKKLIAHSLKAYSSFFSRKKIHISIEGDEKKVLTDEKWSGYILSQIISNAVKYTPVDGSIQIKTIANKDETIISIWNSGKGILEKDVEQIFQKGYTGSEHRTGLKATGYGLYLSKKISDLLGHRITVHSIYNEYAEFSLHFPHNETVYDVTKM